MYPLHHALHPACTPPGAQTSRATRLKRSACDHAHTSRPHARTTPPHHASTGYAHTALHAATPRHGGATGHTQIDARRIATRPDRTLTSRTGYAHTSLPHRASLSYPRHDGATGHATRRTPYRHTPRPHAHLATGHAHTTPLHRAPPPRRATGHATRRTPYRHTPRPHDRVSTSHAHTRRPHAAVARRGRLGLLCTASVSPHLPCIAVAQGHRRAVLFVRSPGLCGGKRRPCAVRWEEGCCVLWSRMCRRSGAGCGWPAPRVSVMWRIWRISVVQLWQFRAFSRARSSC